MPELPEVETVARQLAKVLKRRKVIELKIIDPKLSLKKLKIFRNSVIKDVVRSGKQVVICFSSEDKKNFFLAVHLRMSGRLIWKTKKNEGSYSDKHVRARFACDKGELLFVDTRRFGTFKLGNSIEDFKPKGVDPTHQEFTKARLEELINGSTQSTKQWLLRQDRIVGIGNIYACEILFSSGVSPTVAINSLDKSQLSKLHRNTTRILNKAIENCGTTFSDFQDSHGEIGEYQRFLKVYNREGKKCTRCETTISREIAGGRSTFYCPSCQA